MSAEYKKDIPPGAVLPKVMGGGPHGLGDPNDRSLRRVEIEVMIPKKMRTKTKEEKCIPEVKDFEACCKKTGLSMVLKCRKENTALQSCLTRWYRDEAFKQECTDEYLQERSEYRRTGVKQAPKKKESSTF